MRREVMKMNKRTFCLLFLTILILPGSSAVSVYPYSFYSSDSPPQKRGDYLSGSSDINIEEYKKVQYELKVILDKIRRCDFKNNYSCWNLNNKYNELVKKKRKIVTGEPENSVLNKEIIIFSKTFKGPYLNYEGIVIKGNRKRLKELKVMMDIIGISKKEYPWLNTIKYSDSGDCDVTYFPRSISISTCNKSSLRKGDYFITGDNYPLFSLANGIGYIYYCNYNIECGLDFAHENTGLGIKIIRLK